MSRVKGAIESVSIRGTSVRCNLKSCGNRVAPIIQEQLMALQHMIMKLAQGHRDGFTFDIRWRRVRDRRHGDIGFSVAYAETQEKHGERGLIECIDHATGPNGSWIIGGWYDEESDAEHESDKYYFDSVRVYATRQAAIEAALKNQQIGIYDLSRGYLDIGTRDPSLHELFERKRQIGDPHLMKMILSEARTRSFIPSLKSLQIESDMNAHPDLRRRLRKRSLSI